MARVSSGPRGRQPGGTPPPGGLGPLVTLISILGQFGGCRDHDRPCAAKAGVRGGRRVCLPGAGDSRGGPPVFRYRPRLTKRGLGLKSAAGLAMVERLIPEFDGSTRTSGLV